MFYGFLCNNSGSTGSVSVMTKPENRTSLLSLQVDCKAITKVFSLKGRLQEGLCKMDKIWRVPVENWTSWKVGVLGVCLKLIFLHFTVSVADLSQLGSSNSSAFTAPWRRCHSSRPAPHCCHMGEGHGMKTSSSSSFRNPVTHETIGSAGTLQ